MNPFLQMLMSGQGGGMGKIPQGQGQMPQGQAQSPMGMAMFGDMPFMQLPQQQQFQTTPGQIGQGYDPVPLQQPRQFPLGPGPGMGQPQAMQQPQQNEMSWQQSRMQGWTPETDAMFK